MTQVTQVTQVTLGDLRVESSPGFVSGGAGVQESSRSARGKFAWVRFERAL
jgi:hypothetical protein